MLRHNLCANVSSSAGAVVQDHVLTENRGKLLRQRPADNVARAAGGVWHDPCPAQMLRPVQDHFFRLNGWKRSKAMQTLPLAVILVPWFETRSEPFEHRDGQ